MIVRFAACCCRCHARRAVRVGADLPEQEHSHRRRRCQPGGTGDIVVPLIAPQLGAALGQTVVIENRAGATGAIGPQAVVSAPADGHTLLLGQTGEIIHQTSIGF